MNVAGRRRHDGAALRRRGPTSVGILKLLIGAGAQVNAADRYGMTPLALAAMNGSAPAIAALLDAGADAQGRVGDGETVLMAAARTGRTEAVAAAARSRRRSQRARAVAGRNGADVGGRREPRRRGAPAGGRGEPISTRGRSCREFPKVKVDLATMVTTALPRGGLTALMYAARQGAPDGALALADAGAPLDAQDPDGTTALVIAIINAHYDVAAVLIDKGANLDLADAAGMTPLYAAVDMEHQEPLDQSAAARSRPAACGPATSSRVLLARGANPNAALKSPLLMRQHSDGDPQLGAGATPLMRAAKVADVAIDARPARRTARPAPAAPQRQRRRCTSSRRGAGRNAAPEATAIEAATLLLENGADIQAATEAGQTALHAAVGRGRPPRQVSRGARRTARRQGFGRPHAARRRARRAGRGRRTRPRRAAAASGPGVHRDRGAAEGACWRTMMNMRTLAIPVAIAILIRRRCRQPRNGRTCRWTACRCATASPT